MSDTNSSSNKDIKDNKTMPHSYYKNLIIYLLAGMVAFVVPFVFWCISLINVGKNLNIVKYGVETTATVVSYQSNMEVNGEKIYYLKYVFEDENEIMHEGKTSTKYTLSEAHSATTISIKYDKNYNSIESDFKSSDHIELWLLPVFWGICLVFVVPKLVIDIKRQKEKAIIKLGIETTGTFISSTFLSIRGNNKYYYGITYSYKDEYNVTHFQKTPSIYTEEAVNYYKELGEFKVKYYGKNSVITEPYDDECETNYKNENNELKTKKCLYCGNEVELYKETCPNCSSKKFEKKL